MQPLPDGRGSDPERSGNGQGAVRAKRTPLHGQGSTVRVNRWSGLAPLAAASLLLGRVCALRFLFQADEAHSWFLGHTFGSACWFRAHFGFPCPNCGMTRSLILAAHGEFARSMRLAPGGLAMVVATLATSVMLAALGAGMLWGRPSTVRKLQAALCATVLACAGLSAFVWLGGWAIQVMRSLGSR